MGGLGPTRRCGGRADHPAPGDVDPDPGAGGQRVWQAEAQDIEARIAWQDMGQPGAVLEGMRQHLGLQVAGSRRGAQVLAVQSQPAGSGGGAARQVQRCVAKPDAAAARAVVQHRDRPGGAMADEPRDHPRGRADRSGCSPKARPRGAAARRAANSQTAGARGPGPATDRAAVCPANAESDSESSCDPPLRCGRPAVPKGHVRPEDTQRLHASRRALPLMRWPAPRPGVASWHHHQTERKDAHKT